MSMTSDLEERLAQFNRRGDAPLLTAETQARALQAAYLADAVHDAAGAVAAAVKAAVSRFAAWNRRRRALLELSRLDDRLLADIGLSRGMLAERAVGPRTPRRAAAAQVETGEAPKTPAPGQDNRPAARRAA